jgi:hypothetical protein
MTTVMPRLTVATIAAMTTKQLLSAELAHHKRFTELDGDERRVRGSRYNLLRGPVELVDAWDQWGRLTRAAINRGLTPYGLTARARAK